MAALERKGDDRNKPHRTTTGGSRYGKLSHFTRVGTNTHKHNSLNDISMIQRLPIRGVRTIPLQSAQSSENSMHNARER